MVLVWTGECFEVTALSSLSVGTGGPVCPDARLEIKLFGEKYADTLFGFRGNG